MELNSLQDLYVHELKDLYSAEKQLIRAIPKMEKAAKNKELANGFQEHLDPFDIITCLYELAMTLQFAF